MLAVNFLEAAFVLESRPTTSQRRLFLRCTLVIHLLTDGVQFGTAPLLGDAAGNGRSRFRCPRIVMYYAGTDRQSAE